MIKFPRIFFNTLILIRFFREWSGGFHSQKGVVVGQVSRAEKFYGSYATVYKCYLRLRVFDDIIFDSEIH